MINEWKDELQKYGFIYKRYNSQEKALERYDGVFQQQIWEQRVEHNGSKILINTFISIEDPFREETEFRYVPVLAYRLAGDRVVLPRSDTGVGKFWQSDEKDEALASLIKYALPWFQEYRSLEK